MKIYVLSDLHTECKPFAPDPQATEEAEVIVLAGDIHPGLDGIIWAREAFADQLGFDSTAIVKCFDRQVASHLWPSLPAVTHRIDL